MRCRNVISSLSLGALVGLIALGLCGCAAGGGAGGAATGESPARASVGAGETGEGSGEGEAPPDIESILAANAAAIRDLESIPIDRRSASPSERARGNADEGGEPAARESVAAAIEREPAPVVAAEDEKPEPAPEPTRQERISALTGELAALLRAEADHADAPVSSMAALAALELLERGVAPDPESMPWLTSREKELLSALRELFGEAGDRLASDPNDLLSVHEVIERLPERLSSWRRLSIPAAKLCVRVDGFGQYEEVSSKTLLAGRSHRLIVYTELADFRAEATTGPAGGAGWRVRVRQDLSLYHDSDGLLAWREANQTVDEFSRNRRTDFFLVQLIELPPTLTVGSYRLKVTIVDDVAGATAEAVIPIDVVADGRLTGG